MNLIPRTLFGRLALLLVGVVIAGQLAMLVVFRQDRASLLARQFGETKLAQLQALKEALADGGARERGTVFRIGRAYGARVVPAGEHPMVGMAPGPAFVELERALQSRLGESTEVRVAPRMGLLWIRLQAGDAAYWAGFPLPPPPDSTVPQRLLLWNAFIALLLLAAAYAFARLLDRPLRNLAAAVSAVASGERPPPLPENGPSEIVAVAAALNRMAASLDQLEQERALLLAGVSHDLRTPLARMRLAVEMLPADEVTRSGLVDDIEEIDRSLGQFLEFARSEDASGLELTDVDSLIEEVVARYRRDGRDLSWSPGGVPAASLRPVGIRRVVRNLVDNALRHGGGAAAVSTRTAGGELVIEVADRGPGIPADQVERLKRPFTRLDRSRSGVAGTGLGLAIVDRIARGHGGRLALLPRDGGGNLARVTLPLRASPAAPSPSPQSLRRDP